MRGVTGKCFMRATLIVATTVVAVLALFVANAAAHALLVKSEPEDGAVLERSPERVVAWYSQELDARKSVLRVFDAAGRQVDNGDGGVDLNDPDHTSMLATLPELPHGTYLVRWAAVSADDGDATQGEFRFSVGTAEASTEPPATSASPASSAQGTALRWALPGLGVLLLLAVGVSLRRRRAD